MSGFPSITETEDNPNLSRLRSIGLAVLEDALADGAVATAFDGSLATGRVWPSSDVDVTVILPDREDVEAEWSLRESVIVHTHLTPAAVLERFIQRYPNSFVGTAAEDWFLDSTWFMDGLAALHPVHDPAGRLAEASRFVRAHRFSEDVVVPRRAILLAQAARRRGLAEKALRNDGAWAVERSLSVAVDALAFVWLEAAGRIASHKELDPELKEICSSFRRPEAHALFQTAAGASQLRPCLPSVVRCLDQLLQAYWHRLNSIPLFWPEHDNSDPSLLSLYYHWHRIHSARCALDRGCYMHAAAVITDIERQAAWAANVACEHSSVQQMVNYVVFSTDVSEAREALLAAARRPSLRQRLKAVRDLERLTKSLRW